MSETLFRQSLKMKLPEFLFSQIESPKTAPGFPDTDYLRRGTNETGKIELKYAKEKPHKITLRKEQVVWLRRYTRNGGRCFVAVKVGSAFVYLWEGCHALDLSKGNDIWRLPHWELDLRDNGWNDFALLLRGR